MNALKKVSLLSVLFYLFTASAAFPQNYFGRNKIQYQDFDFNILKTENFNIYYYKEEKEPTINASIMLERWRNRFNKIFPDSLIKDQPVILYANHADFEQTNVIEGFLSQGTGGVTEALKNRIVIPFTSVNFDNDHVLGHELVHAYQYNIIKSIKNGFNKASALPQWFIEGMAEYLSLGRKDPLTSMWLRDAVYHNDLPDIDQIGRDPKYFPYRYGEALWAYIGSQWGDKSIGRLMSQSLIAGFDSAFVRVSGISIDSLSNRWKNDVTKTYKKEIQGRTDPDSVGHNISTEEGEINLSPIISPDGKYIAVISRHDLFTLDLYLIDSKTGKVYKKLVSSNSDAHFDALQFINSSGSWAPDGKKFAFVVYENGDNAISIVDINSGEIEKTFRLNKVDGIDHLAWSPDGKKLAIAGTYGGRGNIYLYNFSDNSVSKVTDDKYSEIQPAWSPDGKILAYATDKGGKTYLDKLVFGSMKIALFNFGTRNTDYLSIKEDAKMINPQFSPDGNDLYFVSDPDGISNIYRYSFISKKYYRITNVATGISGLTYLSPALSVAKNTGQLVFNVFNKTDFDVVGLDPDKAAGVEFTDRANDFIQNISLPEVSKTDSGIVENYLADYSDGLEPASSFTNTDYSPSMQLINVNQASVGVGFDRFGTYLGGSVNLLFSDMLGNHLISASLIANGQFKDIGGGAVYYNRRNRFNWGASIAHIPYLTASVGQAIDTVDYGGTKYLANDYILYRQRVFDNSLGVLAGYPISTNRRIEGGIGFRRISYDVEAEHTVVLGGTIVNDYTNSLSAPESINLFQANLAYVGDYSFYGFTSPVEGSRYRFEVQSNIGSIKFYNITADIRKYFFFNPFTLAFRFLHYGRYGEDSNSERLAPLILGYPDWIRGYDVNSFDNAECQNSAQGQNGCPVFDRLIGSRVGIFNMEFRIPLFGNEQLGLINFPYLPTEISLFLDGGVAWSKGDKPKFTLETPSTERIPVFSAGVAARFNVFGYLIGQVYFAKAFQRPDNSNQFGFLISPGW